MYILTSRTMVAATAAVSMVLMAILSSHGAATVTVDETGVVYDIPSSWTKSDDYETTAARLAWPGKSLADIVAVRGTVNGAWIGANYTVNGLIYARTDASFKVQFQMSDSPGKVKAVRAELVQTAEGVTIRQTGAALAVQALGTLMADSVFDASTTPKGSGGYGVKGVEAYTDVHEIDAFPQPATGGITVNGGTLRVKVSKDVLSSVPVSGNGRLCFVAEGTPPSELSSSATLPANSSWVTVLADTDLSSVTLTGGDFGGGWVEGTTFSTAYRAATQTDGSVIVQLQRLSWGAGRCVRVQLRQNGAHVEAKGVDAYGKSGVQLGTDAAATWGAANTGFRDGGYVISNLKFMRSGPYSVTLKGTKTWQGGTKVEGVRLAIRNSILPDRSTVKVTDGGILQLSAENVYDHYPQNTYDLAPGTQLHIDAFDAVNCGDKVIADAADVKVISDHRAYLDDLTLRNGSTLSGHTVRVGNTGPAVWRLSGDQPIRISVPIETVRYSTSALTFDAGVDTTLDGRIFEFAGREGMPLVKTGAGTLTFANTVASTGSLTLGGGSTCIAGAFAAAGLALADDATLEIAAGRAATFGDSSALAWTAGKRLTLVGAFRSADQTLRIGTTAAGLSREQVKAIRIEDRGARLDGEGWVHGQLGMVILVR